MHDTHVVCTWRQIWCAVATYSLVPICTPVVCHTHFCFYSVCHQQVCILARDIRRRKSPKSQIMWVWCGKRCGHKKGSNGVASLGSNFEKFAFSSEIQIFSKLLPNEALKICHSNCHHRPHHLSPSCGHTPFHTNII